MIAERGKGFRPGCPLSASFLGCSALQQLVGFDTKCLGQLPYDLQACVEGALLKLAQIAPAHRRDRPARAPSHGGVGASWRRTGLANPCEKRSYLFKMCTSIY